ncbi:caspase, EACC1-associated type, partial [Actinocorallia lasiicapitis]
MSKGCEGLGGLEDLPGVEGNLTELARVLRDGTVWALPEAHCTVVREPEDERAVLATVREAAETATDLLLVYYSGHGIVSDSDGSLYLALPGRDMPDECLSFTKLHDRVRRTRSAVRTVIILDCCYSGTAIRNGMGPATPDTARLEQILHTATRAEGSCIFASSPATRPSYADPDEPFTVYTGALLETLTSGVPRHPDNPRHLATADIHAAIKSRLALQLGVPEPQFAALDSGAAILLAPNNAHQPPPPTTSTGTGTGSGLPSSTLVGVLPQQADCFQERETAARLSEALDGGGTAVLSGVLTGMGGVGKTQLAAAYARRALTHRIPVLVWVNASSRPGIIAAYADAATRLHLIPTGSDPASSDPDEAARRFLQWAQAETTGWLVVLDDLQDPADVRGLWPVPGEGQRVLATTRRRDAALTGQSRHRIDVDLYTPEEARAYLEAKLASHHRTDDTGQIDLLASDVGLLPLALAQAAAYLLDAGLDCRTYRERLADQRIRLGQIVPEEGSLPDDHHLIVAATWTLSIERANQARPKGLARPLLELLSVLDPNGIPATLLNTPPACAHLTAHHTPSDDASLPGEVDAGLVRDGLRVLHLFSLISHDPDALYREVRVHQLIQRATRETLTPDQLTTTAHTAADALTTIWPNIERDDLGATLRLNTTTLTNLTGPALWQPDKAHPTLFRAASSLGQTGQVTAAHTAYTHLHTTTHHHLGPDHPDTLTTRNNLAYWRGQAGDPAGAATALQDLLTDQLRVLGPDHPDTLTTRNNLARWRGVAGDPAGAATAYEALLTDSLRVLGPDHPETLNTRHNLAYWRGQAGDPAGAATALQDLLTD